MWSFKPYLVTLFLPDYSLAYVTGLILLMLQGYLLCDMDKVLMILHYISLWWLFHGIIVWLLSIWILVWWLTLHYSKISFQRYVISMICDISLSRGMLSRTSVWHTIELHWCELVLQYVWYALCYGKTLYKNIVQILILNIMMVWIFISNPNLVMWSIDILTMADIDSRTIMK